MRAPECEPTTDPDEIMRATSATPEQSADPGASGAGEFGPVPAARTAGAWRSRAVSGGRQSANALTLFRIFLAVPVAMLAATWSRPAGIWAAALLALAGLTDMLDGAVARRFGITSALGAFLDPLADKCVIDGCIAALMLRSSFPLPLGAVLIGRDVVVTGMRLWGRSSGSTLVPGVAAKAKTGILYAGLLGLLLPLQAAGSLVAHIAWVLVWFAALLSLTSAASYAGRLRAKTAVSGSFLVYLLFPRTSLLLSAGKVAVFLIGSLVALSAGYPLSSIRTWVLVLVCYEFVLSQGKYLLNDLAGAGSDGYFLRGAKNRCPKDGRGVWLVGAFATMRAGAGIVALLMVAGSEAALLGGAAIASQVLYELVKPARLPGRGVGLFILVGAGYGQRALAGMAAVSSTSLISALALLTFLWTAGLGALFLSICWQQQGYYYLVRHKLSPALLQRYKPGILTLYGSDRVTQRRSGRLLPRGLLYGLAVAAVPFAALGGGGLPAHVLAAAGYLACVAMGALAVPPTGRHRLRLVATAVPALVCGAAATIFALQARVAYPLPFILVAIAFLSYILLTSGTARGLLMDGATDSDTAAA